MTCVQLKQDAPSLQTSWWSCCSLIGMALSYATLCHQERQWLGTITQRYVLFHVTSEYIKILLMWLPVLFIMWWNMCLELIKECCLSIYRCCELISDVPWERNGQARGTQFYTMTMHQATGAMWHRMLLLTLDLRSYLMPPIHRILHPWTFLFFQLLKTVCVACIFRTILNSKMKFWETCKSCPRMDSMMCSNHGWIGTENVSLLKENTLRNCRWIVSQINTGWMSFCKQKDVKSIQCFNKLCSAVMLIWTLGRLSQYDIVLPCINL